MKPIVVLLGLLLGGAAAWADRTTRISVAELQRRGVAMRNFSVLHLAGDGRTLLAADEPAFDVKAKGIKHRLWLLRLKADGKLDSARSYDLGVATLEQANFTPDLKSVVLSTRRGAEIDLLNLESGESRVLMAHQQGTPGFRVHSDVFTTVGSRLYSIGYLYDGNDMTTSDQFVQVDPSGATQGVAAFKPLVDVGAIQSGLKGLRTASMLSPDGMLFYTIGSDGRWAVHTWNRSGGLQPLDAGNSVLGSWGEGALGVYTIDRGSSVDVVLANAQTGSKTTVASGTQRFVNPCLSKDGNTLAVALREGKQVSYWVAQDRDGWKLRKVADGLPPSTVRLSHDGSTLALYQGVVGITLVQLGNGR